MRLVLPKWLLNFVSSVHVSIKPLFVSYNPTLHKVKGHEIRRILDALQPGDLMVRRWDGYLNTFFTPGFWAHAGIYAGDGLAIHATGKGVIREDILDFCRADSLAIVRPKNVDVPKAMATARECLGKGYDYEFESGDNQYYCSELCDVSYAGLFKDDYSKVAGNVLLTPDAIRNSEHVDLVLEIKH